MANNIYSAVVVTTSSMKPATVKLSVYSARGYIYSAVQCSAVQCSVIKINGFLGNASINWHVFNNVKLLGTLWLPIDFDTDKNIFCSSWLEPCKGHVSSFAVSADLSAILY
jgi:hypothetical protein